MQDHQGKHLGVINVKQSRELNFQFSVLSRDKSALFCRLEPCQYQRVLSLHSSLMMAMLRHRAETGRLVSEVSFASDVFSEEQIEDIKTAWKKLSKLDLVVSFHDTFKEQLEAIASRPFQGEIFIEGGCQRCGFDLDICCCSLPENSLPCREVKGERP